MVIKQLRQLVERKQTDDGYETNDASGSHGVRPRKRCAGRTSLPEAKARRTAVSAINGNVSWLCELSTRNAYFYTWTECLKLPIASSIVIMRIVYPVL